MKNKYILSKDFPIIQTYKYIIIMIKIIESNKTIMK